MRTDPRRYRCSQHYNPIVQSASQPYHPNLQRPNRYDNDRIQYIVSVVRCFVLPIPLYIPIFWYRFHPRKAMIGSHVTECASTANGPRPHCATRHDGTRSRPGYAPANVTRPGTGRASSLRLRTGQVGLKGAWQPRWSRDSLAPTLYSKMVKGTRTLLKNAILIDPGVGLTGFCETPRIDQGLAQAHCESVSGRWGFSLGVLIASCPANSNFILAIPNRCAIAVPQI